MTGKRLSSSQERTLLRNTTIHDVAKLAGVSIATVSRVINNNYPVDPETRERVDRAIRDIGYYPDAAARTMRGNKSFVIGYVVSDIANSHFTVIARALEDVIGAGNYSLLVCSTGGDQQREENYLRALLARKISGLVINATGGNDSLIAKLSHTLPVTLIYRRIADKSFRGDYVGNDDFDEARRLAVMGMEKGHRRIGLICGPANITTGSERRDGFLSAMAAAGVKHPDSLLYYGDFLQESGMAGAQKLLKMRKQPTLLAVMNNAMALGVMTYLRTTSLKIPKDLSFVSFGDINNRELLYFQPTVLSQNPGRVGETAGRLLLKRIANPTRPAESVMIPGEIILGDSLAEAPD